MDQITKPKQSTIFRNTSINILLGLDFKKQKMCDYKEAIEKLKSLDLSTYPHDEIRKNIGLFGKFGAIQMMLHPGKVLIRARPSNPKQSFTKRSELSYKPKENNKTYQRASTPNQTMFYAGTIPEDIKVGELDNARIIASLEASRS